MDDRPNPAETGAPSTVSVPELVALIHRDLRPAQAGRPWVMLNMITSLDGAIEVDGLSGGLGGPADRASFRALRSCADTILVGAGTVRAEGYRSPARDPRQRAAPRLAIVSARAELDPAQPPFSDATVRHLVFTCTRAPARSRDALAEVCDVVVLGEDRIDLGAGLRGLRDGGDAVVLCEGGPRLNHQLAGDDLLDELCLTLAPRLVGGGGGMVSGPPLASTPAFCLARVVLCDGLIFTRHLRDRLH